MSDLKAKAEPVTVALSAKFANLKANRALQTYLEDRARGSSFFGSDSFADSIGWFMSKRANDAVNQWLMNARLSNLAGVSPSQTGYVSITRERIDHIRSHRQNQTVGIDSVVDLFNQLFVEGGAAFAQNDSTGQRKSGYEHQVIMFRAGYKSKQKDVSGQSPAVVLSYKTEPLPHLAIETGYWMRADKADALKNGALK